jgi:hypothetical protein
LDNSTLECVFEQFSQTNILSSNTNPNGWSSKDIFLLQTPHVFSLILPPPFKFEY